MSHVDSRQEHLLHVIPLFLKKGAFSQGSVSSGHLSAGQPWCLTTLRGYYLILMLRKIFYTLIAQHKITHSMTSSIGTNSVSLQV